MKIERNDQCPCGNEQKFKKCCALKPNPKISEAALGTMVEMVDGVLSQILSKVQSEEFSEKADQTIQKFAQGLLPEIDAEEYLESEFGSQQYLEYLVFQATFDGQTLIQKHLHEAKEEDSTRSDLIKGLASSCMSFFSVAGSQGPFLVLKDLLTLKHHFVLPLEQRHLHLGDVLTGRMLNTPMGKLHLSAYGHFTDQEIIKEPVSFLNFTTQGEPMSMRELEILQSHILALMSRMAFKAGYAQAMNPYAADHHH